MFSDYIKICIKSIIWTFVVLVRDKIYKQIFGLHLHELKTFWLEFNLFCENNYALKFNLICSQVKKSYSNFNSFIVLKWGKAEETVGGSWCSWNQLLQLKPISVIILLFLCRLYRIWVTVVNLFQLQYIGIFYHFYNFHLHQQYQGLVSTTVVDFNHCMWMISTTVVGFNYCG